MSTGINPYAMEEQANSLLQLEIIMKNRLTNFFLKVSQRKWKFLTESIKNKLSLN